MPRVSYTQQFKNAGEVEKFPEYKLRTAEKSRGWLPDEPWMEWYHRIEAPLIADGEVQMEVKDTKRGPIEVQKMDWIGSAFCLGKTGTPDNPGPMILDGIDPANCPVCEFTAATDGLCPPVQRFAAPIIKYKIKGRGQKPYELITPTTAEVLVWAYTGRIHGMLHDLAAREDADLRKLDITVDLEDTPGADTYQKIKTLAAIREPAWKDERVKQYIRALWADAENRPTDEQLRVACKGRDYPRLVLADMVRRAERQWRDAERGGGSGGDQGAADAGFNGSLDEGIGALLDEGPPADRALPDGPDGETLTVQEKDDIFADIEASKQADPTATGATTTGTGAPAAESRFRTAPKSAQTASGSEDSLPDDARDRAISDAADDMFGESAGDSAPPEPSNGTPKPGPTAAARGQGGASGSLSKGNGAGSAAAAAPPASEQPSLDAPDPEPAVAVKGGVVDFDDLFSD